MLINRNTLLLVLITVVTIAGCFGHTEIIHWGSSTDSQVDSQVDKAGVVNLTTTDVNKGGVKMDLAFWGIYGQILWHCVLLIGLSILIIVLTKYLATYMPFMPKALFSFAIAGMIALARLTIGVFWKQITAVGGELILDAIFSAILANWSYSAIFKKKLFKRD